MPQTQPLAAADVAALMFIAAIWGLNSFFSKYVVDALPPLFATGVRASFTGLIMAPLMKPVRANWPALLGVVLLIGPLHFGIQFVGIDRAHDLSPMVIAMQLWIPASVAAAALMLKERVPLLRWAGVLVSFIGIVVLAAEPSVMAQLDAMAMVGLAAIFYAIGAVLMRRHGALDPLQMQGWIALLSAPVLFAGSAVLESGQIEAARAAPFWIWGLLLFAAVVSSLMANVMMFRLVQRYEVSRTTPYVLLSPFIAIGLSIAFHGDPVSAQLAFGAALSLGGVALVALAERRFR
jgi:O-acetylserine/cysteine efflux transporter